MQEIMVPTQTLRIPQLAVPLEEDAIAEVNRWLHREVGFALNTSSATFNSTTYCWHLPIHLAYGATGSLGIVGDVYLHAATGEFVGAPEATELQRRAEALAAAHGIEE
jgi:hypothetical protein